MNNRIDLQIIFGKFFDLYNLVSWIFIILDLILIFGFAFSFYQAWKFRPKIVSKRMKTPIVSLQKEIYRAKWFDIINKFEVGTLEAMKIALIQSDNLVDLILKDLKIKGQTLSEKLSKIHPESLESLKDLWEAHHIVGDIIQNPNYDLNKEDAQKILSYYERFLKEIGVII
ncbi:MAG: hypothetical protein NZ484_00490 [Patescibacteria group bacterium]|nr:hypothetical protein [Patescibacteria group bacterium]MCX7589952.1 hypothetical protein [Patescibacteria group bacterium]